MHKPVSLVLYILYLYIIFFISSTLYLNGSSNSEQEPDLELLKKGKKKNNQTIYTDIKIGQRIK